MSYPQTLQKLVESLCRFPGIGPKTAQRLAFFLLAAREEVVSIARAMVEAKDKLFFAAQRLPDGNRALRPMQRPARTGAFSAWFRSRAMSWCWAYRPVSRPLSCSAWRPFALDGLARKSCACPTCFHASKKTRSGK